MSGAEYPKALYKDGGADLIWGAPVRTLVVDDSEQEVGARERGWRLHPIPHPLDHDRDGRLGGSLPKRGPGRPRKVADAA